MIYTRRFVPPPGLEPITVTTTFKDSPFEYDRLSSNPSLELWAIRLPSDFKPSRLSSLSISDISESVKGTLQTRHTPYDLVPAGVSGPASHMAVDAEGRQPTAGPGMVDSMTMQDEVLRREGGEEMGGGMRLLVPRLNAGGKLLVAPIPIKRHLLLTPRISDNVPAAVQDERPLPSFLSTTISSTNTNNVQDGLPAKRTQPAHLLKFRNRAFGFDTPGPDGIVALNTSNGNRIVVDTIKGHENALDASKKGHKNKSTSEPAEKSPKKRKVENGVTPENKKKKVKA
ncbi:hypothetical protein BCR39DRAFT_516743 [Naematelia encephala]|uniref:Uncharacterized protein n=1 Tax=Naematelia encephala TaxID=71784 RepID=A0A1Y2BHD4_9TREE|nr:hypothetical protein BCR39DRAFT_516743 [Naematelia encephala]